MTHTPGPLRFSKQGSGFQFSAGKILEPTDKLVGFISGVTKWRRGEAEANAHRIVATWNACEGISTDALEASVVADLLEACEAMLRSKPTSDRAKHQPLPERVWWKLEAVIAKAQAP